MNAIEIARTGLDIEWRRLEVIAQNLANMNSTRGMDGEVYRPLTLVSGPAESFSATLETAEPRGVRIIGVEAQAESLRRVLEPHHPHADAEGFVTYPNVDHAREMTLMIRASRAYEANLAAVTIAQDMYRSALDMGRQS